MSFEFWLIFLVAAYIVLKGGSFNRAKNQGQAQNSSEYSRKWIDKD